MWDLVEVKSTTSVKGYHLDDMALQRYAFAGAGYDIRQSILMHLDNQYVKRGPLDVEKLFHLEDCTVYVEAQMAEVMPAPGTAQGRAGESGRTGRAHRRPVQIAF